MDLALATGHQEPARVLMISHKHGVMGSLQIEVQDFELDQRFPLDLAKSVTQFSDQSTFDRCLINDVLEKIKWREKFLGFKCLCLSQSL